MAFGKRLFVVALCVPIPTMASGVPPKEPIGMEAAIKKCVGEANLWQISYDAFYNPATGLIETNFPSLLVGSPESKNWELASFEFRKCMTAAGFAPTKSPN